MSRAPRAESREDTGRKQRTPVGVMRPKMLAPERPGYKRRWFNATEGRLHQALTGDYTFVEDPSLQIGVPDIDNVNRDLGSRVSRVVDKATGQRAYLMEIKDDYYQDDQETKLADVEKIDHRIKTGNLDGVNEGYVPKRGISIETKRESVADFGDE